MGRLDHHCRRQDRYNSLCSDRTYSPEDTRTETFRSCVWLAGVALKVSLNLDKKKKKITGFCQLSDHPQQGP